MRVLVTGGAGYIGSILVQLLLADGMKVMVLDNFSHGQMSLNHLCSNPALTIIRGDARDVSIELVDDVDVILPLAAIVGAPACDAAHYDVDSINYEAVISLLNYMTHAQYIVYPMTNSGYGIGDNAECTEDSPLRPVSLYGRLKVDIEKIVMQRENAISLRLATVFGMSPRMRLDLLVNDFVYRAVTDHTLVLFEGHFRRNFIHVRDVANAFVHAISNFSAMRGRPYNVGLSNANLTKLELCQRIAEHVHDFTFVEAESGCDPDKRDYVVSNARIEATGWRPRFSLDDGIRELIIGYRQMRRQYANI